MQIQFGTNIMNNEIYEEKQFQTIHKKTYQDVGKGSQVQSEMDAYKMLCEKYPDVSFVVTDRTKEGNSYVSSEYTGFCDTKQFGDLSKLSVEVDVSVLKKLSEDSNYAKELDQCIRRIEENYSSMSYDTLKSGMQSLFASIYYEDDRIKTEWTECQGTPDALRNGGRKADASTYDLYMRGILANMNFSMEEDLFKMVDESNENNLEKQSGNMGRVDACESDNNVNQATDIMKGKLVNVMNRKK